jgi:hypothetical protein
MSKKEQTYIEVMNGCIDQFAYGGFDVIKQCHTAPVAEDRKFHRIRWYLYQFGKYIGQSFETDKEAMFWIDSNRYNS